MTSKKNRTKPLVKSVQLTLTLGGKRILDANLNLINPYLNRDKIPFSGMSWGDNPEEAIPITGAISGLPLQPEQPKGRPPQINRDVAVAMAVDFFFSKHKQKNRACRRVMQIFKNHGITKIEHVYHSIKKAEQHVPDRCMGLMFDSSGSVYDSAAIWFLKGSTITTDEAGILTGVGRMWIWHYDDKYASLNTGATVTADMKNAPPLNLEY